MRFWWPWVSSQRLELAERNAEFWEGLYRVEVEVRRAAQGSATRWQEVAMREMECVLENEKAKEAAKGKEAEAYRPVKYPNVVKVGLWGSSFMHEMHATQELYDALRNAVDTGRMDGQALGDLARSSRDR